MQIIHALHSSSRQDEDNETINIMLSLTLSDPGYFRQLTIWGGGL